ncbi:MAG: alpha-2-macroglobulin family protein [Kiritimatiellia bacterium]
MKCPCPRPVRHLLVAVCVLALPAGRAGAAAFDFKTAWEDVRTATRKALPRTATNLLARISSEAIAARRWPDAARAAICAQRIGESVCDDGPDAWFPAFAARVDAAPAEIQGVLRLHLASVCRRLSEAERRGGRRPTELAGAASAQRPPWSSERIAATLEAQFAKILAHADQLQRCPVEAWSELMDVGTMPAAYRPTLFDVAIHDMVDFYGTTIPDTTLAKGCALLDRRIAFHRNDAAPDALADAELARLRYVRAFEDVPETERTAKYVAALDAFVATYRERTDVSALAAFCRAEEFRREGRLVAAHDLAAGYRDRWPESVGGKMCRALVSELEKPDFRVETERTWATPGTEIEVRSHNLPQLVFRIARIPFDVLRDNGLWDNQFYRDASRKICRDVAAGRLAAKTWRVELDNPADYAEHVAAFPVPSGLAPGHYLLLAAMDGDFTKEDVAVRSVSVTVTGLALAVSAADGLVTGRVFRAESGLPAAGVTVELWESGARAGWKKTGALASRADGTFALARERFYGMVRAVDGEHEVLSLDAMGTAAVPPSRPGSGEHVELVTDRAIYRPGQDIHFKGLAYAVDPAARDFRVCGGRTVIVDFVDPNGKSVRSARHRTTEWGSFHGTLAVPADRATGACTLTARLVPEDRALPSAQTSSRVRVEEYRRPKFSVAWLPGKADVRLGTPTAVAGAATTCSGLPVQYARVKWRVRRTTRYPAWREDRAGPASGDAADGPVAAGETMTDGKGAFELTFTPRPDAQADLGGEPVFAFELTAEVVDDTGETRVAVRTFRVGTVAWRAAVSVANRWLTPSAPVAVGVAVDTHDGVPVAAKGRLAVHALVPPPEVVRAPPECRLPGWPADSGTRDMPWDWRRWKRGACVKTLAVVTDATGAAGLALDLPAGAYRLEFSSADPHGRPFRAHADVCVFDPDGPDALRVPDFFAIERTEVPAGGTIRCFWSSGYATGTCRIAVMQGGKTLWTGQTDIARPRRLVEIPVTEEHRGRIAVMTEFMRENRLYRHCAHVNVPWDDKRLAVTAEHLTSRLEAGARERWTFRVTSRQTGAAARAEVLAFMYDKSLDAFCPHRARLVDADLFCPWGKAPVLPAFQNGRIEMAHLSGHFPAPISMPAGTWPSFCAAGTPPAHPGARDAVMASGVRAARMDGAQARSETAPRGMAPKAAAPEPDVPIRRNLRETAFFLPDLVTDADGRVSFTFTAPDALTGWQLWVLAHDRTLASGVLTNGDVVTRKALMVEPVAPRFAREGDDFRFAVKVTNTSDTPQKGDVSLAFRDVATDRPAVVGGGTRPFALGPSETKTFEFPVAIPDGQGFLAYVAKAAGETFADGEEGWLPVLSRRIFVQESVQLQARGAETRTFVCSNLLASAASDTIRHQDLAVEVVSRPAWYAVLSLPYLMEYPHACNEQTFNRYYANALGAFIVRGEPKIRERFDAWRNAGSDALKSPLETNERLKTVQLDATPWVRAARHETAARARLGALFEAERLADEQARCLEKLRLGRTDGLWPWFPGGRPSLEVTIYILTGFARLHRLAGTARPDWFDSVCRTLDGKVAEDVAARRRKGSGPFRLRDLDVRWLYLHSFGQMPEPDRKTRAFLRDELERRWPELGLATQAEAAIALCRAGRRACAREIMASLKERAIVSDETGMYWKRPPSFASGLFAAPVSAQAARIEAFHEVAEDAASVEACRVWLLKQKRTQNWSSTATTADAVYALLLDGGSALLTGGGLASVRLGGVEVPVGNAEAGTGRHSYRFGPEAIRPEMGNIAFTASGTPGVAWGGVHWSYFEDVLKVRAHEPKGLRVEKKYYRKVHTPQGVRLEAVAGAVEQGDELVARLAVTSDRVYEYVHLKDERPSCCEPEDVLSAYRWRGGVGFHQATRDTATHYCFDRLEPGEFVLETSFRVQRRGVFSGGLATVQCLYAPEFAAHSGAETIEVR